MGAVCAETQMVRQEGSTDRNLSALLLEAVQHCCVPVLGFLVPTVIKF